MQMYTHVTDSVEGGEITELFPKNVQQSKSGPEKVQSGKHPGSTHHPAFERTASRTPKQWSE
jgi:hypothetical protein